MRRSSLLCAAALACVWSASWSFRAHAQQPRTVNDGVYTAAQATRGEAAYRLQCVMCHGASLAGDAGPPLTGDGFLGPRDEQPVSDLFDKIRSTMPQQAPGTLTESQVADLVAFILQVNRFPAGSVELAASPASLRQIALVSAGTGRSEEHTSELQSQR